MTTLTDAPTLESLAAGILAEDGPVGASWGREPAHFQLPGFAELVPEAASLLATPLLRPPYVSLFTPGRLLPTRSYCRSVQAYESADPELLLDADRVAKALDDGCSVKFNRMELWSPAIAAIAAALRASRGLRVKAWGFYTRFDEEVLPPHRDRSHVVAVQLAGRKRWRLAGPCPETSWKLYEPVSTDDVTPVVLQPGDLLYLPHGWGHSASAETELSFHVSFALEGGSVGELEKTVLKALGSQLAGTDATEIRPDNVDHVVDRIAAALTSAARGFAAVDASTGADARAHHLGGIAAALSDEH